MTDPSLLVVADDLTGATDTAHEFAARGYRAVVVQDSTAEADSAEVLAVNADTRTAPPEAASAVVSDAIERHPADLVFKKLDSTMRGNVVAEVDAAVEASRTDLAVLTPAAPDHGRIVAGGHLLVDGSPVDGSESSDRESPLRTSELTGVLSESRYPVARVALSTVARGPTAVRERLGRIAGNHGTAIAVCDATTGAHIDAVAVGADRIDASVVYAGSSGLAEYVCLPTHGRERRILGVVGSTNERTIDQLTALSDDRIVALDVAAALAEPATAGRDAADRYLDVVADGGACVVASARTSGDVAAAYRRGNEQQGLDRSAVRDRIRAALVAAVDRVWERSPPDGLFVTGGSVATAVFDSLGVERVALTGRSVAAGVPVVRLDADRADSVPAVTKAGGFGATGAIRRTLAALEREASFRSE